MASHLVQRRQRHEFQIRLSRWMEIPLASLGLVMVVLLILDLSSVLSPGWEADVHRAETFIWAIFVVDFVVELAVAPNKLRYVRKNWLTAISVLLPAFGAFRILRAAQLLRGLNLIRVLTTLNRGSRAIGHVARRGQLGYVAALTAIVTLTAAASVYYFEHAVHGSTIRSFGDAIWWAATLVTTINTSLETTTLEGRIIGFLLRIFALGVTGYVTAIIAVHLLGFRDDTSLSTQDRAEIGQLRREIEELRSVLQRHGGMIVREERPVPDPTASERDR
jgi:voltage-gated potassium channel